MRDSYGRKINSRWDGLYIARTAVNVNTSGNERRISEARARAWLARGKKSSQCQRVVGPAAR